MIDFRQNAALTVVLLVAVGCGTDFLSFSKGGDDGPENLGGMGGEPLVVEEPVETETRDDASSGGGGSENVGSGVTPILEACTPVALTRGATANQIPYDIGYNPDAREYAIVLTNQESGRVQVARVNLAGELVMAPKDLEGEFIPSLGSRHEHASIDYVASSGKWIVGFHREGPDDSFLALIDDWGTASAGVDLDSGTDSETQDVVYHPGTDQIVSTNDVGGIWETRLSRFDSLLQPIDSSLITDLTSPGDAAFGSLIALPELIENGEAVNKVLTEWSYREGETAHRMIQLVDLEAITGKWPSGTSFPNVAGKSLGVEYSGPMIRTVMAWAPSLQRVGIVHLELASSNLENNIFLQLLDPVAGQWTSQPVHVNAAAPSNGYAPQVGWDGSRFIVAWTDARDEARVEVHYATYQEVDGELQELEPDTPLPSSTKYSSASIYTYNSIIGHDGRYAIAYYGRESQDSAWDAYVCLHVTEP